MQTRSAELSGRYFVSDEAENAAEKQIIDNFRAANEAKIKLEAKLKSLGERLSALGKVLQDPKSYVFYVDLSDSISVGQPDAGLRRPIARVTPSDFDWKDLCETLRGFNQATEDRKQSIAQLKALGIPVAEN
jgi:hypothetical protein